MHRLLRNNVSLVLALSLVALGICGCGKSRTSVLKDYVACYEGLTQAVRNGAFSTEEEVRAATEAMIDREAEEIRIAKETIEQMKTEQNRIKEEAKAAGEEAPKLPPIPAEPKEPEKTRNQRIDEAVKNMEKAKKDLPVLIKRLASVGKQWDAMCEANGNKQLTFSRQEVFDVYNGLITALTDTGTADAMKQFIDELPADQRPRCKFGLPMPESSEDLEDQPIEE